MAARYLGLALLIITVPYPRTGSAKVPAPLQRMKPMVNKVRSGLTKVRNYIYTRQSIGIVKDHLVKGDNRSAYGVAQDLLQNKRGWNVLWKGNRWTLKRLSDKAAVRRASEAREIGESLLHNFRGLQGHQKMTMWHAGLGWPRGQEVYRNIITQDAAGVIKTVKEAARLKPHNARAARKLNALNLSSLARQLESKLASYKKAHPKDYISQPDYRGHDRVDALIARDDNRQLRRALGPAAIGPLP